MKGLTFRQTYVIFTAFLTVFGIFLHFSLFAEAHSSLEKTFPAANEKLEASPSTIELWFQDPVVTHSNTIEVANMQGETFDLKKIYVDSEDDRHIVARLKEHLPAGRYKVEINVLALDGYVVKNSFHFVIKEPSKLAENKPLKLERSSISDGEILNDAPKQLELWFNQPAEISAVGIFDDQQKVLSIQEPKIDPDQPNHIIVTFKDKPSIGTHQVTWYAYPIKDGQSVSELDTQGVFYFAVNEVTSITSPEGTAKEEKILNVGIKSLAYWFSFIGLVMLFGTTWFDTFISKKTGNRKRWKKTSFIIFGLSFIGYLLLLLAQWLELGELSFLELLSLKFAYIPALQMVLLLLGLFIKKLRLLLYGIALLLSPFVVGHASYPRYGGYFTMGINMLHLIAVSIWTGGLFGLIMMRPKHDDHQWIKNVGISFSKWALASVLVIILSGVWMTSQYLPSFTPSSLVQSQWGRALLLKVILLVGMIVLGYLQRRSLKRMTSKLTQKFSKRTKIEVTYGIVILLFAASLVASTPSAAEQGIYPLSSDQDSPLAAITPFKVGVNDITLQFENEEEIDHVRVKLFMAPLWRVDHRAFPVGNGTYKITGNFLHASGTIEMKAVVFRKDGTQETYPYQIVVPGDMRFNESN